MQVRQRYWLRQRDLARLDLRIMREIMLVPFPLAASSRLISFFTFHISICCPEIQVSASVRVECRGSFECENLAEFRVPGWPQGFQVSKKSYILLRLARRRVAHD